MTAPSLFEERETLWLGVYSRLYRYLWVSISSFWTLSSKKRFWTCSFDRASSRYSSFRYLNFSADSVDSSLLRNIRYWWFLFFFFHVHPIVSLFILFFVASTRIGESSGSWKSHGSFEDLSKIFRRGSWMSAEGRQSKFRHWRERTCLATYKHFSTWHVYVTLMVNRATGKGQFILQPIENFLSSWGPDRRVNGRWCTFCLSFTARAPCTWMTLHCGPIDRSKGDGVVASSVVLSPPRRATA